MNKKQIEELIKITREVSLYIENEKIDEAYHKAAIALGPIRDFVMILLELEILEQDMALMLMTDLVEAIEYKDEVLLLDTFKYGIGILLQNILSIMEEEENE